MSGPEKPVDLDAAAIAELYGRDASETPPASVDAAVLAAARAGAEKMRHNGAKHAGYHRSRFLTSRWPAAFASAAVFMVTIAVLLQAPLPTTEPVAAPTAAPESVVRNYELVLQDDLQKISSDMPMAPAGVPSPPPDPAISPALGVQLEESVSLAAARYDLAETEVLASVQAAGVDSAAVDQVGVSEALLARKKVNGRDAPARDPELCRQVSRGICRPDSQAAGLAVKVPGCEALGLPDRATDLTLSGETVRYRLAAAQVELVCRKGTWNPVQPDPSPQTTD